MKCAIILAGGKGTRMKSEKPKVMCEVLFEPMLYYVISAVKEAGVEDICVITGYEHGVVEEYLDKLDKNIKTALQSPQLGTGHAVMQARHFINSHTGDDILIMNGDGPLIDAETISKSYKYHKNNNNAITLLSAVVDDPFGLGRIKRDKNGTLLRIVEEKDASDEEKQIDEVCSGMYWFKGGALLHAIDNITNDNAQKEYYLTDTLEILIKKGENKGAYIAQNSEVILGANDRVQLNNLNTIMRRNINNAHMINGVDIPCTDGVMIGKNVKIGNSTQILPNTIIIGDSEIGENCVIGPNCFINNAKIADGVILDNCKVLDSEIEEGVDCGPFVKIRANSVLKKNVHIGNFVEVKNSIVGEGTKSAHLTYIGDSDVGSNVNFGCGTVTCNYDGKTKSRCSIGNDAFIGCNTNLIAPVEVGERAYIAAGSTITSDIPTDALSVARAKQVNKEGWVKIKKPYKEKKK
ncbi:MAG: bifunctional UDP-N-acetylglucosamine diphosphorylase/glucosamine-1-phosphate N-acetyltransferase GlmU [Eubacterium sp.]|nr:bifunctional UDP-N-acetylglucosamine diphosphorylase/glucosamine-1-phosphate N-acetyltransferase GlmU [Eubacterium sp.]